ncbi:transporter substrate-binding domain-containing protein [Vibrio sp. SCSIO 43136]|uniref:substrate-binding periplasmic protein n=1 Tax=Vibrio sp. SCSIO 43136 TaxID=2819101 RepID=UPI002075D8C7|nr:transporter substrate-binding domain-containing protein [Vibrio sp. SCSIO 43136]
MSAKPWLRKVVVTVCAAIASSGVVAADRVLLATQIWTPYQTVDGNGKIGGIAVDRVKCAMQRMGQPYEIRVMRWDKAQLMVETDQMHGFFAGSGNSQRASYAQASTPVISEYLAWFVSPNVTEDVNDETAKYSLRFGAKFNTNKWLHLKRNGYNVIKKPRDADALLQMLWQGDLDVAYEYELVFEESMKNTGIPLDYFKKVRTKKQDLMVHFSRTFLAKSPGFLDRFNSALQKCL